MKELKITQDDFAERLGVSRYSINQIVNGHRTVTANMAIRLEKETKIPARRWLIWQADYDLEREREK